MTGKIKADTGRPRGRGGVFRPAMVLTLAAVLSACEGVDVPGDQANERLSITNNQAALDARVTYVDEDVSIDAGSSVLPKPKAALIANNNGNGVMKVKLATGLAKDSKKGVKLRLKAYLTPPEVEGELVQATAVTVSKETRSAVISYNMRGAPRLGAVDLVTFKKRSRPKLSSTILFSDSDINSVTADGAQVYAAVATDAPEFTGPAVMERIRIRYNKMILDDNARVQLSSFAATSTVVTNNAVYATSGDGGHVAAFDKDTLEKLGEYPLDDARWVAWDKKGGRIVVAQGTPGRLAVFEEGVFPGGSMNLLNTFSFPGANIPESKSTVVVEGGKAFVAAGTEGVQIMCLDDGQILGSVPIPDPASLGLDPSVVVSNSVSVDDELLFISNGEAGVYVARASDEFEHTGCNQSFSLTVLGKLKFGDLQSVNHVAVVDKYLLIAAGTGGFKIVEVKK